MRQGILITRGAIIEASPETRWSIAMPLDTSVLELAALMRFFGLYCELEDGGQELRLLPLDFRPAPTAASIASFYAGHPTIERPAPLRYQHAGA